MALGPGGKSNVTVVESCAQTRLRLRVVDPSAVDKETLLQKDVGACIQVDDNLMHLLVGLNADQYAAEMSAQVSG